MTEPTPEPTEPDDPGANYPGTIPPPEVPPPGQGQEYPPEPEDPNA